jgi:hypothetical protein
MRMNHSKAMFLGLVLAGAVGLTASAQVNLSLLNFTSTWKYQENGTNLPPNPASPPAIWTTNNYNDSSWPSGQAPLGYPANENLLNYATMGQALSRFMPGSTTVQVTSYFFRTTFNFPSNVTSGVSLVFSNIIDDGCIVHLNGMEIYRLAMPTGAVNAATKSTRANDFSEAAHGMEVTNIPPTYLRQGVNQLAVQVHQGGDASSDAVMSISLNAIICSAPRITNCPPNVLTSVGSSFILDCREVITGGCANTYRWYKGTPGSATFVTQGNPYYSVSSAALTHSGNYFMIASNISGTATSCVVNVEVVDDIYPPGIVSAIAQESAASNTLNVVFTENLRATSATNPANYRLVMIGTTNVVPVTRAQPFLNTVTLTVGSNNWFWGSNYLLTVNYVTDTRGNSISTYSNQVIVAFFKVLFDYGDRSKFYDVATAWLRNPNYTNLVFYAPDWRMPNFNDSDPDQWPEGSGGPYYFDANPQPQPCFNLGTAHNLGFYLDNVWTYYFRTRFVAPTNTGRATLQFSYFVDDGAVMYLNGVEIGRVNMPAGPITPDTRAPTIVDPSCSSSTNVLVSNLRSGTNVLAVEVHQADVASFDLWYGVKIRAAIQEALPCIPPLKITRTTSTGVPTNIVNNTHVRVSWDSTNCPGWRLMTTTNLFSTNWVMVATSSPFTTNVAPRTGRYFNLVKPVN